MLYLTRWRMNRALTRLQEEGLTVVQLAGELGYQSEAAFSRVFKRLLGVSPGSVRLRQRLGSQEGNAHQETILSSPSS